MASFSKGTSFTDGVTGDVTAAKLHALVDAATPVAGLVTDRTAKTSVAGADLVLLSDSADSNNLKKVSVTNFANNLPTAVITNGTVTTLNSTTGTITGANITTGTVATLNSTAATITTGTIPTLVATTLVTTGTGTAAAPALVPTGDTDTGLFFPAADTIAFAEGGTEAMRIDSSGNVGIGNTVAASIVTASGIGPLVVGKGDGNYGMVAYSGTTHFGALYFADGTTGQDTYRGYVEYKHGDDYLRFGTNASERLRIDSSGRVGIGTTAPSARFSVSDGTVEFTVGPDGGTSRAVIGTESNHALALKSAGSTQMTLDTSGRLGIGDTTPSYQLELSTDSAGKPSTNTWTIASDARLKTNVTEADTDRCLEIVRQIPLKRYTWRDDVYSQEAVRDRSKLGWIAQDVESVFPKAVGTKRFTYNQVFEDVVTPELDADGNPVLDEDGNAKTRTERRLVSEDVIEDCKDLNSDQIYAVMYGAIQKLAAENDSLKSRVAALEAA